MKQRLSESGQIFVEALVGTGLIVSIWAVLWVVL